MQNEKETQSIVIQGPNPTKILYFVSAPFESWNFFSLYNKRKKVHKNLFLLL
jgi:hypothetical protein